MNEKDQLIQAREQFQQSLKDSFENFKNYGRAVASHTGAIYAEKKDDLISRMEFIKLEREMERDIKERTREHKVGMKEALREQDREQRREKILQIKQGVKQKTSSVLSKLGQVRNDTLAKLNNIDMKLRDFYERMQIAGLEAVNKGKEIYNSASDKIDAFTASQISKYYEKKEERRFEEQQKMEELERKAQTRERKEDMKTALREQDREQRKERILQIKQGVKQKTSSVLSKLGQVRNDTLAKINNIDMKLRDFYERMQISGLEAANKGKEIYNNVADKIDAFTASQISKYYEKKEERKDAKEFKEAARLAEKEELDRIKQRKVDMKAALNAAEREMYETRHLENEARKKELIESLYGTPVEEQTLSYAR